MTTDLTDLLRDEADALAAETRPLSAPELQQHGEPLCTVTNGDRQLRLIWIEPPRRAPSLRVQIWARPESCSMFFPVRNATLHVFSRDLPMLGRALFDALVRVRRSLREHREGRA